MRVALAARLLYDEWKSRPQQLIVNKDIWGTVISVCTPQDDYLAFLKTQAVDSTAKGHAAYKLAVKWINAG